MTKRKEILLLVFLVVLLLIINYNFIDSSLEEFLERSEQGIVERIIDGDTVIVNNESVRLLGINCPERGERYYDEATDFLKDFLLGKSVKTQGNKKDRYYRNLKYLFLDGKNINVEMVKNGFANVYILDDKNYEEELRNAWEKCIEEGINLCEKSNNKCANCIELKGINYKDQEIIFHNKCNFNCELTNWSIKDEGRKKFIFENFVLGKNKDVKIIVEESEDNDEVLFWKGEDYVWTSTGDTLFLRDNEGNLVLWKNY